MNSNLSYSHWPEITRLLNRSRGKAVASKKKDVGRLTTFLDMEDGTRLATEVFLPQQIPAPVLVHRTPYGRKRREELLLEFANLGYVVVSQDCRGTGDSEPSEWTYYLFEPSDSKQCIDWVLSQAWCNGFVGGFGGSYSGATQWCMAAHPAMSMIAPEVAGLGVKFEAARLYMYLNAYSRSVGNGAEFMSLSRSDIEALMLPETLAGGFFNDPIHPPIRSELLEIAPEIEGLANEDARRLIWSKFVSLPASHQAALIKAALGSNRFTYVEMEDLFSSFGRNIAFGAHSIPSLDPPELARSICAPALVVTGWYDWNLNDTLASWECIAADGRPDVASRSRLLISPSAHNAPGYTVDKNLHPELQRVYRTPEIVDLLDFWCRCVSSGDLSQWPPVIYYLMGANEWHFADSWPPVDVRHISLYLRAEGELSLAAPTSSETAPDEYVYDPDLPTPTVGGSIVSYVYTPGSVGVSEVQKRADVLTFTTKPLANDLDVVGPLKLTIYVSTSAVDTDFTARLSDVFPDGTSIHLQSGIQRLRYRAEPPALGIPGTIYVLEVDLWATANRFKRGHRIRLDIASADFPRFERNANLGGLRAAPKPATQKIFHDKNHPSHFIVPVRSETPPQFKERP